MIEVRIPIGTEANDIISVYCETEADLETALNVLSRRHKQIGTPPQLLGSPSQEVPPEAKRGVPDSGIGIILDGDNPEIRRGVIKEEILAAGKPLIPSEIEKRLRQRQDFEMHTKDWNQAIRYILTRAYPDEFMPLGKDIGWWVKDEELPQNTLASPIEEAPTPTTPATETQQITLPSRTTAKQPESDSGEFSALRRPTTRTRVSSATNAKNADNIEKALLHLNRPGTAKEIMTALGELGLEFTTNAKRVPTAVRHAIRNDHKERFEKTKLGWGLKEQPTIPESDAATNDPAD